MTLFREIRSRSPESVVAARAIVDTACASMIADGHVDSREVEYATRVAEELLSLDHAAASETVTAAVARIRGNVDTTIAEIRRALVTDQQKEVAYLVATGVIYGDGHLAHRETRFLSSFAEALGLERSAVDRISTSEPLTVGALYPETWRRSPKNPSGSLQAELEDWGRAHGFLRGEKVVAVMKALDLDAFVRLVFPECGDETALLWAAKYTAWLYLSDDALERLTAAGDLTKARAFVEPYLRVLATSRAPDDADSLAQAFAELTREIWDRATAPDFAAKWEDSHREYWLDGTLRELLSAAKDDTVSPLRHHLATRPGASGVAIYFDMAEVLSGCAISLALRNERRVRELRRFASLVGGIFNDLLSYDKEKPFENLANVALAIRRELGLDDRGAVTYTVSLHNALVEECDRRITELSSAHAEFGAYADSMRFAVHGLAAWQLRSLRYKNRHTVVISDRAGEHPSIDADRLEELCGLAAAAAVQP